MWCPFCINRRCHLPSFTFCWFIWDTPSIYQPTRDKRTAMETGPPDLWALPLEPKTFRSCRWSTRAAATCLVSGTWSGKNRHVKQNFNVFSFIFEIAATKNASFRNGQLPKFFFLFSQIDGGLPCYLRLPFTNYHVWLAPPRVVQDLILEGHLLHFSPCGIPTLGYHKLPNVLNICTWERKPIAMLNYEVVKQC